MYLKIRDPRTNTDVSIFTKRGKSILKKYIIQIGGEGGEGEGTLKYMIDTHFHPIDNFSIISSDKNGNLHQDMFKILNIKASRGIIRKYEKQFENSYVININEHNTKDSNNFLDVSIVELTDYIGDIYSRYKEIGNSILVSNLSIDESILKAEKFPTDIKIIIEFAPFNRNREDVNEFCQNLFNSMSFGDNQIGGAHAPIHDYTNHVYSISYQYQDPVVRMPCEYAAILLTDSSNSDFDINEVTHLESLGKAFPGGNFVYVRGGTKRGAEGRGYNKDGIDDSAGTNVCKFGYGVVDCCYKLTQDELINNSLLGPQNDRPNAIRTILNNDLYQELKNNELYKNFKNIRYISGGDDGTGCPGAPDRGTAPQTNPHLIKLFRHQSFDEIFQEDLDRNTITSNQVELLKKLQQFLDLCVEKANEFIGQPGDDIGYDLISQNNPSCNEQLCKPLYFPISVFELLDKDNINWQIRSEMYHLSVSPCLHHGLRGFDISEKLCKLFYLDFYAYSSHMVLHSIAHAMDRLYGSHAFVEDIAMHKSSPEVIWDNIRQTIETFAINKQKKYEDVRKDLPEDETGGSGKIQAKLLWEKANRNGGIRSRNGKLLARKCQYDYYNEEYGYKYNAENNIYAVSNQCAYIKHKYGCKRGQCTGVPVNSRKTTFIPPNCDESGKPWSDVITRSYRNFPTHIGSEVSDVWTIDDWLE